MLWQNASARTVPTARPASSRRQVRSSSVRTVVAPSRRLQKAAKSWRPTSGAEAAFIASRSRRRPHVRTWWRTSGSPSSWRVHDPVGVAAPDGGEPRVEALGRLDAPGARAGRRAGCRRRGGPARPAARRSATGRRLDDLRSTSRCTTWPRACTPASVRPATVTRTPLEAQGGGQRRLELALDRAQPRLGGPAGEVGAVVGTVDPQAHGPILGAGPGRVPAAHGQQRERHPRWSPDDVPTPRRRTPPRPRPRRTPTVTACPTRRRRPPVPARPFFNQLVDNGSAWPYGLVNRSVEDKDEPWPTSSPASSPPWPTRPGATWWPASPRPTHTVGDLAAPYDVSLQAVSKHLKVLEDAGLVTPHPGGPAPTGPPGSRGVRPHDEVDRALPPTGRGALRSASTRCSRRRRTTSRTPTRSTRPRKEPHHDHHADHAPPRAPRPRSWPTSTCPIDHITRDFHATPAQLFRAHTDPELFPRWVGPGHRHRDRPLGRPHRRQLALHRPRSDGRRTSRCSAAASTRSREDRIVQTFTWEGMPDGVALETLTFEDLGDGRTRLHAQSPVSTASRTATRGCAAGMETGVNDGYAKLDRMVAEL